MNNPFIQTIRFRLLYGGIWLILTIAQVLLSGNFLPDIAPNILLTDAIAGNILQAVCLLALWYPVKYYRNIVNIPLFVLFHFLLLLIAYVIWIGLGFVIVNDIVPDSVQYAACFFKILPGKIFLGFLIYTLFVLIYYLFLSAAKIKKQSEIVEESLTDTASVEKLTRVSVKMNQEIRFISINQILYIEANGDYVLIHTAEKKYLKDRTMKYWEAHLPDNFVRIHRSFIVNIETIAKIELYEKESYKVQLKTGHSLKTSNAGYKFLKERMQL